MDSSRQITAFIFLVFLFFVYKITIWDVYFYGPQSAQQVTEQSSAIVGESGQATSQAVISAGGVIPTRELAGPIAEPYPSDFELAAAGEINILTESLELKLSLLGGRLSEARLVEYRENLSKSSRALNLIQHVDGAPLPLGVYYKNLSDAAVQFTLLGEVADETINLEGDETKTIIIQGQLNEEITITKALTFHGRGHLIDTRVQLQGADEAPFEIEWTRFLEAESGSLLDPYDITGYVSFDGERANHSQFTELKTSEQDLGQAYWASIVDKYFLTSMLSIESARTARMIRNGDLTRLRMASAVPEATFSLYVGPKSYQVLIDTGYELQRNVDFGWFGFMSAPLLHLLNMLYGLLGNYGLAIVALTVLVKIVIFPLSSSSFKQMKAMQDLQPEMQRIREKVKDRQQQQMELMTLYKKKGVNPIGGCFPIFLQMPVFFGLFSALRLSVELRHAEFAYWFTDLSEKEYFLIAGINIPILVVLWVLAMLMQQWTTPSPMEPAQKRIMMVLPVVFGFMIAAMPAGLTLYMFTSSMIAIAEQKAMRAYGSRAAFLMNLTMSGTLLLVAGLMVYFGANG